MATLVFDIGGTRTRAGLYDSRHSRLIRSVAAATPNHLDFPNLSFGELRDELLSLMGKLGDDLAPQPEVGEVDVAFAGPIDPEGNVLAAPTLWGARLTSPYALREDVVRRWSNARVRIVNDVTAAGYRYLQSDGDDFCIVTVSSGIGNKVFANGRPLVGRNGLGGELGHLRVDDSASAPICECGGRGHLGAVSSGRAVLAYARRCAPRPSSVEGLTSGDLAAAFRREEPWATKIVEHGAGPLGWALAAMHLGLGVERFVLVGGFALALGDAYRRLVAQAADARCWDAPGGWDSRVELGVDDDFSGLIGAGIAGMAREGTV
jgi:C7-cyclitol 7-kinase